MFLLSFSRISSSLSSSTTLFSSIRNYSISPRHYYHTSTYLRSSSSSSTDSSSSSCPPNSDGVAACDVGVPITPVALNAASPNNPSVLATPPHPIHNPRPLYATQPHNHYDLVVIGSGPSGKNCAINAAKNKKRVAIIDKKSMFGGVCIHTGTIPSKTFREAIMYLTGYRQGAFYGKGFVRRDAISSDHILDRVQKVISWEADTLLDQLHRNRVQTIQGTARFIDSKAVEIIPDQSPTNFIPTAKSSLDTLITAPNPIIPTESNIITADHFLISCGTRPARNTLYPFHSPLVFDADQILQSPSWDKIRHLIVIGSGVIAIEYASMFNNLPGCRVTIIDEKSSFLDFIDSEIVQTLKHILGRSGATFRLGEKVSSVDVSSGISVKVALESGKTVIGDALFYAVGRQANTDTLNIEAAGVNTGKRGLIQVNEYFQTNVPHIYATGDIIGFPALASTAQEQGRLASQHMWATGKSMQPLFPYGIYTIPEISVVGLSEQELTRMKIPYEIGLCKFEETAKGQMIGGQHIDGFLKLLFCPNTHKLLGCAAIGESAVEIIHIGQAIMSQGGTIEYFRDSVFNYPTFAECYRIAALDGLGRLGHYN